MKALSPQSANLAPDMRNPFSLVQIRRFVLANLIISLALCLSFCPRCFLSVEGLLDIAPDFTFSFLISSFLSGGISIILRKSDRLFPWLDAPVSRLLFDLLAVTAYSFVVSFLLSAAFGLSPNEAFDWDNLTLRYLVERTYFPISIALIITAVLTSRSFLLEWRQSAIEAERMRSERLAGQYQSLKDQLNPHFLFNSLNVLSGLVYEDASRADAFIQKLSGIYRYVLEVQDEELVPCSRELDFARDYLDLQQLRFGEKFTQSLPVGEVIQGFLPPLTLQLLLENIFKHNQATRSNPLHIEILIKDNYLFVTNSLQLRKEGVPPSGLGLKNIRERYRFLTGMEIQVTTSNNRFQVALPILFQTAE